MAAGPNSKDSPPENIIYIFLDGIGFGSDSDSNPFSRFSRSFFKPLGGKGSFQMPGIMLETDANMGISGLPQSATGQTALFTGFNGPEIMGRHINGFPTFTLRPYLKQYSLIRLFHEKGLPATLANSYSPMYLKRLENPRNERILSASSHMQLSSGQKFFSLEDYREGRSIYMDLTNWFLRRQGIDIPMVNAAVNGANLARISRDYKLTVFEYFFTDKVGHEQSMAAAKRIIAHVEDFLEGLWSHLDPSRQLVVISSDHGNLEDLSVKTHTANPVPTILYGAGADQMAANIRYLYDIPRQLLRFAAIDWYSLPQAV